VGDKVFVLCCKNIVNANGSCLPAYSPLISCVSSCIEEAARELELEAVNYGMDFDFFLKVMYVWLPKRRPRWFGEGDPGSCEAEAVVQYIWSESFSKQSWDAWFLLEIPAACTVLHPIRKIDVEVQKRKWWQFWK